MQKKTWTTFLVVVAVLALGLGARYLANPALFAEQAIETDFTMTNAAGETVTAEDFRGQWMMVYFGYTYCPDVCPTSLGTLARALGRLPEDMVARIRPIFISVDPDRDTPEGLAEYAPAFHPRLIGLTGTEAQVAEAARNYKVVYQKVEAKGDGPYLMDHSASIYLVNPEGRYVTLFPHGISPKDMAGTLTEHLGGA